MRLVAIATLLLSANLLAQEAAPQRTLRSIVREHRAAITKASQAEDPAAYPKAVARFCQALREYLKDEAKGEEVHETRFQLVFALMSGGKRDDAKQALQEFDPSTASCISCAEAAYLASNFRMQKEYEAWIAIALSKKATRKDRMELGVLLMSKLRKPELATKLFDDALAAAKGDEAKAEVMWHLTMATREREDVGDNAYDESLRRLAREYPKTRWGGIARDRVRAMNFEVGGDPLPLAVGLLDGGTFSLKAQRGNVVLLCFYTPEEPRSVAALKALQKLHAKHAARGLKILGISLGSLSDTKGTIQAEKLAFDQAHVPGGFESDLAMRFRVEDAPHCLLLGRNGKIAGMNFVLHDSYGFAQLKKAVERALDQTKR